MSGEQKNCTRSQSKCLSEQAVQAARLCVLLCRQRRALAIWEVAPHQRYSESDWSEGGGEGLALESARPFLIGLLNADPKPAKRWRQSEV